MGNEMMAVSAVSQTLPASADLIPASLANRDGKLVKKPQFNQDQPS